MEKEIIETHPDYKVNEENWEFYLRSYLGGDTYREGNYLVRYLNESNEDYKRRLDMTPIDNHCSNVVHIYSSFLWRTPPTRNFNSLDGEPFVKQITEDADLDGNSINAFMREAQIWSSVYGHVWIIVDKPKSNAQTRAEELQQEIRPYLNLYTPENVFDWKWERTESGRYKLTYLKIREQVIRINSSEKEQYFRVWTEDTVSVHKVDGDGAEKKIEEMDNPLGVIPAVYLPAARTVTRGIGRSDIADISVMQKAVYNELSEIEQLIRISNHPTLVKTYDTDATAGAGGIVHMPDELDPALKPYMLQPSGANLDSVQKSIEAKVTAINRMAHLGAVRGTDAVKASGIALQTEFQLLNSRLSEKADILELAEQYIWYFIATYQNKTPDVEVDYPDSFDIRDYPNELQFLQQARASGVQSATFTREIDKMIADLIADDDVLQQIKDEIDSSRQLGDFAPPAE